MTVLLELPADLCHSILIEWIELESWCSLDTACCNQKLRPIMVNQFHKFHPVTIQIKNWSRLPYTWCYVRRIYLKNVDLHRLCFDKLGTLKDCFHLDKIEKLSVYRLNLTFSMASLTEAINSCVNLKSLCVFHAEILLNLDGSILRQLTELVINAFVLPAPCLPIIQANATNLRTFCYMGREEMGMRVSCIADIIINNPDLEYLRITAMVLNCSPFIQAIIKSCRNFHTLTIVDTLADVDMDFTLTEIMQLQLSCPQLKEVTLRNRVDRTQPPEARAFTWRSDPLKGNDLGLYHYDKPDLNSYLTSVRGCTRMNLSHISVEKGDLRAVAANNSRLESLSLEECEYDSESLGALLKMCSELKELSLTHREVAVKEQQLLNAFSFANSLSRLTIYSRCLSSNCIVQIILASPNLKSAKFFDMPKGEDLSEVQSFVETHRINNEEKVEVVLRPNYH